MELNRERIVRGLACCKGSYDCFTCDIYKRGCAGFREGLAKDALSLINELAEENDYWKQQAFNSCMDKGQMDDEIRRLTEENERLREKADRNLVNLKAVLDERSESNIVADTVRKMQERIAEHATNGYPRKVRLDVIDQIAKEMLEDYE